MKFWTVKTNDGFRFLGKLFSLGRRLVREPLELLCPATCAVCRTEIEDSSEVLCRQCWSQLQENLQSQGCPVCGHDVGEYSLIEGRCHRCQRRRPVVNQVVRVGDYYDTLRELVLTFKFRRQSRLDKFLGDLLAAAIMGTPEFDEIDMLVPIPLHWRRRWSRKYDQAELLALAAAQNLKQQRSVRVSCDLVRVRNTPPQTSLLPNKRLLNLKDAFAVRPDHAFADKHICLIDDVTTTGTTLRVAAQTLRKAGAKQISAAVLAVAANK